MIWPDRAANLLIGLTAQRLDLIGEAADGPRQLVDRADHLDRRGGGLGIDREGIEGDLQLADLDRDVAAVAGRAEGHLQQVLERRDRLAAADHAVLAAHLGDQELVGDARDVGRPDPGAAVGQDHRLLLQHLAAVAGGVGVGDVVGGDAERALGDGQAGERIGKRGRRGS